MADAEGEAGQRDDVDRPPRQHQDEDGRDETDGDRDREDRDGAEVAQEEPEHDQSEEHAEREIADHEGDGAVDEDRRVERLFQLQVHRLQRPVIHLRDDRLHLGEHLKHVGAVLAHHADTERGIAVLDGVFGAVGARFLDRRDVAQLHGMAVAPGERQFAQRLDIDAALIAHRIRAAADIDAAGAGVSRRAHRARDVGNGDAELGGLVGIEGDAQLVRRAEAAFLIDAGNAGDRLDLRDDDVLDVAAILQNVLVVAGQRLEEEIDERGVGILVAAELQDGAVGLFGQALDAVEARDHVERDRVHVGADFELQRDERAALVGERSHVGDGGQALQHVLDLLGDLGFHLRRSGSAPGREDRQSWAVDVGEELRRHRDRRIEAEQKDERRRADRRDGILHAERSEIHPARPPGFSLAGRCAGRIGQPITPRLTSP